MTQNKGNAWEKEEKERIHCICFLVFVGNGVFFYPTQPDSRYASDSTWIREVRGWPDQANLEEFCWKFLGFCSKSGVCFTCFS